MRGFTETAAYYKPTEPPGLEGLLMCNCMLSGCYNLEDNQYSIHMMQLFKSKHK